MKTIDQTYLLARQLMNEHGLNRWSFKFDKAKRRAGQCRHYRQTITLSYHFVCRNNDDEIKDVILHEIAHALAGPKAKHGSAWKAVCRRIGARPVRCYDSNTVDMPKGQFKAVCKGCQKVFHRHRRVRVGRWRYCLKCGPELGRLEFGLAE
jgi:predicted SprT family Zn-dependent metalloprotease